MLCVQLESNCMAFWRAEKSPERLDFEADAMAHMDALYANALKLTRRPTEAEDLVQETYLKAYRFHDHFERGTNLKAWLFRIQYNTFVNRYRRTTKEQAITNVLGEHGNGHGVVSGASAQALLDPESAMMRPILAQEIEKALARLPLEHREVVLLADVEQLRYKEIAEVLGCPIGTVMSRLHRARKALQTDLLEHAISLGIVQDSASDSEVEVPVSLAAYRRERKE
jgi:RNA polymerase sigma-70 factor (ECF subfamily)